MKEIKGRLEVGSVITVHDNLLANLYELDLKNISSKNIDGEEYLVNEASGRYYKVALIAKIPKDLLMVNGELKKYDELSKNQQEIILNQLKARLYFTNVEILFTNILFDRYLKSDYDYDISLKEIERHYRRKGHSKNVKISDVNYERYISTLSNLTLKEITLTTEPKFRNENNKSYGVSNLKIKQKFLNVFNLYDLGENNIGFTYSFQQFGKVIKKCRRYSNSLIPRCYQYRLNQAMKHSIAYFIGIEIFIRKNPRKKYNNIFILNISRIMQKVHYETRKDEYTGYSISSKLEGFKSLPNKLRTYKMVMKYIKEVLDGFVSNGTIYEYEINYDYDETEEFQEKHEYDYELDGKLSYRFTLEDISRDVDVSFMIYLNKPNENII